MNKIYEKAAANPKAAVLSSLLLLLVVLCACIAGYYAWQHHTAKVATYESQIQAQTAEGVDLAAKAAHVSMLQSQLQDAAQQIGILKDKPPNTIIKTVPVEVEKVVTKYVQSVGADFGIVTDPKNPSKPVDLKEIAKLPADTPITLNQYNVFAYKKIIRGFNVYPDWGEVAQRKVKINEIAADWSKRVTKDGKYLGVAGGYDFKHEEAKLGLRYTF